MTKKHFDAFAEKLRSLRPIVHGPEGGVGWTLDTGAARQWAEDCEAVADVCAKFNPKFDRARFLGACEQ
jgi:hypothetical protein